MANAMEDGLEDQFLGDPPEMIPLHRENSAPQYIPAMSSGSSPFVQFKHNCAILASMGFTLEQSQEALFRAVRDGVPLGQVLEASIEMLVEGHMDDNIDEESGEVRRKSASEFEDVRLSTREINGMPEVSPDMRRAVSDPVPESASLFVDDKASSLNDEFNGNSINQEVSSAMFRDSDSEKGEPKEPTPTAAPTPTTTQPSGATHAAMATDDMHCGICWDDLTRDKLIEMEGCKHTFCHECCAGWLGSYISDGKLTLHCPSAASDPSAVCRTIPPMLPHKIESLITVTYEGDELEPPLLAKYRRFKEARDLESNTRVRWCTSPGCGSAIRPGFWIGNLGGRKMSCASCKYEQCFDCGRAFHGSYAILASLGIQGTTCEDLTDKTLQEYALSKHLQPCPNCKKQVEKIDACPHMTCPCGHNWCWVCRASYPCSGVHFGVSGSGSGEEIGSVLGVQRLSVISRFVSALFAPLFTALMFALASIAWSCFCVVYTPISIGKACMDANKACSPAADHKYPTLSHHTATTNPISSPVGASLPSGLLPVEGNSEAPTCIEHLIIARRKVLNKFRRLGAALRAFADSLYESIFPDEEGIFYLILSPCFLIGGLTLFAVVFSFSYAASVICIGGAVLYLLVECGIGCVKKGRQVRRILYPLPGDPGPQDTEAVSLDSSLDLNLDATQKDAYSWTSRYQGPLPSNVWRGGRICLAGAIYAVCMPISLTLSIALCPLYPFIPLPLLLNPRGRVSFKKLIPLALVLAAATTACLWYWLLSEHWSSGLGLSGGVLGSVRAIEDWLTISGGSDHDVKIIIIVVIFAGSLCCCGTWLYKTPTSFCSCCIPLWNYAYSLPFTVVSGRKVATEYMAFAPPPDFPTQLPLVAVCECWKGTCGCGWDSD